jgi:hypothetical protein
VYWWQCIDSQPFRFSSVFDTHYIAGVRTVQYTRKKLRSPAIACNINTSYSITQRDRPMEGAFIVTVELAWLYVLCSLPWRVNGRVEPWGTVCGGVECTTDEFVPDSVSTGGSNGTADWLMIRGPAWNRASSSDPNMAVNVGIGKRVEGKSNFSSERVSSPGTV